MSYVRFQLPRPHPTANENIDTLASNMLHTSLHWIDQEMYMWAAERQVEYRLHTDKDAVYVEFAKNSSISLFMLTWRPGAFSTSWKRISIVNALPSNEETNSKSYNKA